MKVMHVLTSISNESAGPSHSVPALCSALNENGCDVTLYVLGNVPNKKFNFKIESFSYNRFLGKLLGHSSAMKIALIKDAKHFDIIHSHMLWKGPNYYCGDAARKNNKPLIIAPRGTVSKWALEHSKWKKKIVMALWQKKALQQTEKFHVTSMQERNEVAGLGFCPERVFEVPNGVTIPQVLSVKQRKKRIVFLSRIHEKKGVDILLHAWSGLYQLFPEWELGIVGPVDNDYADKMKSLATHLGCERVSFTGELTGVDKDKYLQESLLFVLPTHSENFGMVVAEALANGVPVICSKGAPWERLNEKKAGWWIDIGIEPLKSALVNALSNDHERLIEMGKNGRGWMKDEFSWNSVAKRIIVEYKKLRESK